MDLADVFQNASSSPRSIDRARAARLRLYDFNDEADSSNARAQGGLTAKDLLVAVTPTSIDAVSRGVISATT